jgi:hypothetical protein
MHLQNQKNVVDSRLLLRFLDLDVYHQNKLSRKIGTTPDHIIDNLLHLQQSKTFFS